MASYLGTIKYGLWVQFDSKIREFLFGILIDMGFVRKKYELKNANVLYINFYDKTFYIHSAPVKRLHDLRDRFPEHFIYFHSEEELIHKMVEWSLDL